MPTSDRLEKLRSLRNGVNWDLKEDRRQCLNKLHRLIDKPEVDEDGEPLLRRTTALHRSARGEYKNYYSDDCVRVTIVPDLFKIYDENNYVDEFGLTHFHVACKFHCFEVIEKFLELRQVDPNHLVPETGYSPLHLVLDNDGHLGLEELLLRKGADPNAVNAKGSTPLHVICKKFSDENAAIRFFDICEKINKLVRVNVKNKLGQTPLQLVVANLWPKTVDRLLDRGADLSSFVFPTESLFFKSLDKSFKAVYHLNKSKLKLQYVSNALAIVERLVKRGYELDLSDVLTIMKLFARYELFENSDLLDSWLSVEDYSSKTKEIMLTEDLSLYDLIQLQPKKTAKHLNYKDYFEFPRTHDQCWHALTARQLEACALHLCEKMSKKFFERWALDSFMELIHYRLPILCCDLIVDNLKNQDLYNICLVAAGRNS
uniref:Uncharacterized protein n=1 Tax=Trichogramma kaykai TaxID=54128 RepID=A0ABD2XCV0_9HYME